jgi:phosphatidylglycerophosphate synthase
MTTLAGPAPEPGLALVCSTAAALLGVAAAVAAAGTILLKHPSWAAPQVLIGFAGYAALGSAVAAAALWRLRGRCFGLANQVTLLRAGLTCLMGGALFLGGDAAAAGWTLIALASLALGLDGLDGWLARRFRLGSSFGARFDAEVDALLLLMLALLVWHSGRAGPWVLAIGLMRYAFVFGARLLPALRRPLPESRQRKAVFALQGAALIACLLPPLPAAWAAWLAGAALLALTASFALDVRWLLSPRARPGRQRAPTLDRAPPVGIFLCRAPQVKAPSILRERSAACMTAPEGRPQGDLA